MRARLLVITPCRDEAAHARTTLESVVAQTVRPDRWVLVDDGSSDGTGAILAQYAAAHPWISVVRAPDRGRRSVGPGVVQAFEAGLASVALDEFEFVCKLDLDLELPPRYFETLLSRMAADPRLGSCSGKPYVRASGGRLLAEPCGDEMSVGMTKLYRVECFRQIGGFLRAVMWDGIDCHQSRMLGWKVASWDEPELRFVHLRPMGSSQRGLLAGRARHGAGQWFLGTGAGYLAVSAAYRALEPPPLVGGLAILFGYLRAAFTGAPRYDDPEFRRFLRRYQRGCLLRGKRRATARVEAERAALWRGSASD